MEPTLAWLEDPTVFRVNRLDAHSDHVTYLDIQELAAGKTSLRQSLDGALALPLERKSGKPPRRLLEAGF